MENNINCAVYSDLIARIQEFAKREDQHNIVCGCSEKRPLEPVYEEGNPNHVGYIQKGPRVLIIEIADCEHDGDLMSAIKGCFPNTKVE